MAMITRRLATMLRTKMAIGVLAAVIIFGVGMGTVAAAASKGTFGQQVKEQVQDCKQGMATNGAQGIGDCVSDFAQQHGKQQRHQRQQQQQQQQQSHAATGAFGQKVNEQIQDCKQGAATNGAQGIGDCVSDFAQLHGKQQRHQH